jgi:hypothetical protein
MGSVLFSDIDVYCIALGGRDLFADVFDELQNVDRAQCDGDLVGLRYGRSRRLMEPTDDAHPYQLQLPRSSADSS